MSVSLRLVVTMPSMVTAAADDHELGDGAAEVGAGAAEISEQERRRQLDLARRGAQEVREPGLERAAVDAGRRCLEPGERQPAGGHAEGARPPTVASTAACDWPLTAHVRPGTSKAQGRRAITASVPRS